MTSFEYAYGSITFTVRLGVNNPAKMNKITIMIKTIGNLEKKKGEGRVRVHLKRRIRDKI